MGLYQIIEINKQKLAYSRDLPKNILTIPEIARDNYSKWSYRVQHTTSLIGAGFKTTQGHSWVKQYVERQSLSEFPVFEYPEFESPDFEYPTF